MKDFSTKLLQHYHQNHRDLPWRGEPSAYHVWLSEIMLQQTTVVTVIPYYNKFLEFFPTVEDLANADLDEVLHLWQGLGYYSRARNLHKCAQVVTHELGGVFPSSIKELEALPGIGNYTACAIRTMAFNKPAAVLDGNVERVIARMQRIETPLPKAKPEMKAIAETMIPSSGENDAYKHYSNAIMELGATICTPKNPKCLLCPVANLCASFGKDDVETFPRKEPKKKRPTKQGTAYIIQDKNGRVYLQQRPETGLLAKLWEVPSEGWDKEDRIPQHLAVYVKQAEHTGNIKHVFTHFTLLLDVKTVQLNKAYKMEDGFYEQTNLPALPTLMRKVLNVSP